MISTFLSTPVRSEVEAIDQAVRTYAPAEKAPATRRAYRADFDAFGA